MKKTLACAVAVALAAPGLTCSQALAQTVGAAAESGGAVAPLGVAEVAPPAVGLDAPVGGPSVALTSTLGGVGTVVQPTLTDVSAARGLTSQAVVGRTPIVAASRTVSAAVRQTAPMISAEGTPISTGRVMPSLAVSSPANAMPMPKVSLMRRLGTALTSGVSWDRFFDAAGKRPESDLDAATRNDGAILTSPNLLGRTSAGHTALRPAAPPPAAKSAEPGPRLDNAMRPDTYDIHLNIDPEGGKFSGTVKIAVDTDRPLSELTLHALDLDIRSASVDRAFIDLAGLRAYAAREMIVLPLAKPLAAGRHVLELSYRSALNLQMKGLYQSRSSHGGAAESYAFTHLEATDARRVFPSFDEPAFKAKFNLTVTAPEHLTTLSNMPAVSETRAGGLKTTRFAETPKMSTYLLAAAVARLTPKSVMVGATKVTVWTRPEDAGQAGFALEAAEAALTRLNAYFGLPYQLPKLDLIAVPDFSAGAMENWGAIFLRDSALLIDPKLSSTRAKRWVAMVVAHEIVHQWFGNLVTMAWWNDLWLNEAFATWLSYKIVGEWKPEWNAWLDFEARKQSPLAIDALRSTRAIVANAATSAEIRAMFDPLTYSKGATILRMVDSYLGAGAFREGIRGYMRKYRYRNTVAEDLWRELESASGKPVSRLARAWMSQPGYPILRVEAASADRRTLKFTQERFSADGKDAGAGRWAVPVKVLYEERGTVRSERVLLEDVETTVTLPGEGPVAWVYPNQEETGFYRFSLDEGLRGALLRAPISRLAALEKTGMLGNLLAQVKAGRVPVGHLLEALYRLKDDPTRVVIEKSGEMLAELQDALLKDEDRAAFRRLAGDLFGPRQRRLGWVGTTAEDDEARLARAAALSALGSLARPAGLLAQAQSRLAGYLADPAGTEPTIASALLTLGAKTGDAARFAQYRDRLLKATTPEQKDQYFQAMAQFDDPALGGELAAMTLTDGVRGQDLWKPLRHLLRNPATQAVAWRFVREHWAAIRSKGGPTAATRVIEALASAGTPEMLAEVRAFYSDPANVEPSSKRALAQTLEFIEVGVAYRRAQAEPFSAWLRARSPRPS